MYGCLFDEPMYNIKHAWSHPTRKKYYGRKPDLSDLKIFSSIALIHILDENRQKLDPKSKKCILVGYSLEQKRYKYFNPSTRKVHMSRDVDIFNESYLALSKPIEEEVDLNSEDEIWLSSVPKESPISTMLSGPQEPLSKVSHQIEERLRCQNMRSTTPTRVMRMGWHTQSTITLVSLSRGHFGIRESPCKNKWETLTLDQRKERGHTVCYNDYTAYGCAFMMKVVTVRELKSFAEDARDPQWIEAMNKEMHTLSTNGTWTLFHIHTQESNRL